MNRIPPLPRLAVAYSLLAVSARGQTPQELSAASSPGEVTSPAAPESILPAGAGSTEAAAPSEGSSIEEASGFDELEAAVDSDTSGEKSQRAPAASGSTAGLTPDISAVLDVAAAYFSEDEPLQAGGHDPNRNGFNWQQLEVSLASTVDPYFRLEAHLVFSPEGVEVEEAYATTLALPYGLQMRFGQFLTRFGRTNPTHLHAWNFADQPFILSRFFGGEGQRGLGAELSFLMPLPWSVELVASVTDAAGEGTARSFFGDNDPGVESLGDFLYTTALKQFFPIAKSWSLSAGVSGNFGPGAGGGEDHTEIYGVDLYLKFRPIQKPEPQVVSLQSESFYRRRELDTALLQDFGQFTELMWRFTPRWAVAVRHELGSPSYDSVGQVVVDPLDPDWTQPRARMSASVTLYPTEFSRFRLQQSRDDPGYRSPIWATFFTAEVAIGAHGAHQF